MTGVAGFTGGYLAAAAKRRGWEVLGLVHPDSAPPAGIDALAADLADTERLAAWIAATRPSAVVHLAASSHVVGDALGFYRTNLLGTESLLEAIVAAKVAPRKVVLASSANVYGNAERSPIGEDDPLRPMNHYALSKAAMEMLARKWFDRLPILVTRPFNYTGPGQSEAFVVPKIIAAVRARQPVLRLGNVDVARDLSDVRFIVEAYLRLLESDAVSTTVNLCSGRSVSLTALIEKLQALSGFAPRIEVDPAFVRKDEVRELCGDPSRLSALVPGLSPIALEDTLAAMLGAPAQRVDS